MNPWSVLFLLVTLPASCLPIFNQRTLVGIDSLENRASHSRFFQTLQDKNAELTFRAIPELGSTLKSSNYDNIVLISSDTSKDIELPIQAIEEFMDGGGNVMVLTGGVSPNGGYAVPASFRKLGRTCGVAFDADGSAVQDFYSSTTDTSLLMTNDIVDEADVLGLQHIKPVAYRGIGIFVNSTNTLATGILRAPATSFVTTKLDISPHSSPRGTDVLLMAFHQSRNNARAIFAGDASLCSDATIDSNAPNFDLCKAIAEWAIRERGFVVAENLSHHRVNELSAPELYQMGETVTVSADVYERRDGGWMTYTGDDLQVEIVMLDPYVRTFLNRPSDESATFSKTLSMPDKYGVFKFVLRHERPGLASVHLESPAPIRNPRHDGYPRFLFCAYPFYISLLPLPATAVLCAALFMYTGAPHYKHD